MLIAVLNDFASALRHLGDAEFFTSVGIATFGLAALFLLAQLQKGRFAPASKTSPSTRISWHSTAARSGRFAPSSTERLKSWIQSL